MADLLSREVKYLSGVGEARARLLEREVGVRTIGDLLGRFPYRYIAHWMAPKLFWHVQMLRRAIRFCVTYHNFHHLVALAVSRMSFVTSLG